jgi:pyrroline-5-carboxylate reductase
VNPTIGFIGIGRIASALVEGFCAVSDPPAIILSPRNRIQSAGLSARFPSVTVAAGNQAVVDAADTVFISVRPQIVAQVLASLHFRTDQRIVSLVATRSLAALSPMLAPAVEIVRAVPLPPAARRLGAIPYWPAHPFAEPLLARLGKPLPLETEAQLDVLWAVTGLIAPFYALMGTVTDWAADKGVTRAAAADYSAAMFHALASLALDGGPDRFARLATEAATPGGLNEQAVALLCKAGVHAEVRSVLDVVLKRFA